MVSSIGVGTLAEKISHLIVNRGKSLGLAS
jgi:hypothetical protein